MLVLQALNLVNYNPLHLDAIPNKHVSIGEVAVSKKRGSHTVIVVP